MNTQTLIVTILTLWLVMGLGFLAEHANKRKTGQTLSQALRTPEGLLFLASVVGAIFYFFSTL